ncbi:hypothetical protein AXG89_24760 (plasmid) [Burkholderia sp. PAMC 26561]|nr:hypothetical protein AXG89_24760 [Burkholderia sp. PAMC 26561]
MRKPAEALKQPARDHRIVVAEKKRMLMRTRLIDATMRVYGNSENATPVIDDVISEAKVSRGPSIIISTRLTKF